MGENKTEDPEPDSANSDVAASAKEDDRDDAGLFSKDGNVSIRKLFSMADGWDVVLMVLGTLGACVRGSASFANMLLFGKIYESFGQSVGGTRSDFDPGDFPERLLKIAFVYSGLSAALFVGGFIQLSCWMYTGERQATKLRRKYLQAILTQEVSYFETDGNTAEISNSLTESIEEIQAGIGEKMGHGIGYVWAALSTQLAGALFCWQIALLGFVIVPVVSLGGGIFRRSLFKVANNTRAQSGKADIIVEETVSQIRTVYSYLGETRAMTWFSEALKPCIKLGVKGGLTKGIGLGSMVCSVNLSWALVFYVAGILTTRGVVRPGNAIVTIFCVVYGGLIISFAVPDIEAFANARRLAYPLHRVLGRHPAVADSAGAKSVNPNTVEGRLELQDVHFVYPSRPEATVFSDLSVSIPAGKSLAVVGESGCGKSTIVALLARFYDPIGGRVLLDGEDLKTLNLLSLRKCIGLVGQEPALFATTIMENIGLGRPGATPEECIEAAKAANAHAFISFLPDGYQTHVGERGAQLSGGQKQRIAIARAVVKNPSILLLDEATSALDAESESIVQEALDSLMLGRTCIVVAHRLSTVSNVDAIAVLSAGKIVEQGSPSELLAMGEGGKFYQLKHTQEVKEYFPRTRTTQHRRIISQSRPSISSMSDSPQSDLTFARWRRQSLSFSAASPGFMLEPSLDEDLDIMSPGILTANHTPGRYSMEALEGQYSTDLAGRHSTEVQAGRYSTDSVGRFSTEMQGRFSTDLSGRYSTELPVTAEDGDMQGKESVTHRLGAFSLLKLIFGIAKPEWKNLCLGWFGATSNGAVKPALAFLVVKASLVLFNGEREQTILRDLRTYCVSLILVALYATVTSTIEHSQLVVVGHIVSKRIRERLFAAILKNEVGWYDKQENKSAMITGRLAGHGASINVAVSSLASSFINNISAVVFAIVIGLFVEWRMTLVNTGVIPLFLLSGFFRYRISQGFAAATRESNEEVTQLATEAVVNIRTVYSFTLETQISDRLISLSESLLKKTFRRAILAALGNGASASLPVVGYTICVFYIQTRLKSNTIDFAAAMTVFQLISNTSVNLSELVVLLPTLPKVIDSANSIYNILNRATEIDADDQDSIKPANLTGLIELKEVQFRYPSRPEVQVLNNVNLQIKAGQTVALVGESGSGKSSIISLIERFYDTTGGQILIDNVDIKKLNLEWLRERVGLVQQEPTLFNLTIRDNILYGKEGANEVEMVQAVKSANAHNFISALPRGYATMVGDRGTQLSGGQKQRLAIARAILKNPSILLLDEATSALDTESEKVVQEALDRLLKTGTHTTLVVAHRLSTIQDADTIVVMSKGRIKEQGNHSTLLRKGGLYARLLATTTAPATHNEET